MTRRTLSEAISEAATLAEQRDRSLLDRKARRIAKANRKPTRRRTATATKRGDSYSFSVVECSLS